MLHAQAEEAAQVSRKCLLPKNISCKHRSETLQPNYTKCSVCTHHVVVVQVAALSTLLELVRSQQVGVFDHKLFTRACTVLLQQPAVSQGVLELLISKYLQYADVR